MKWKIATASAVTAAMLSAPMAAAAPADNNINPNPVVGQAIAQVTGVDPTLFLQNLNGLQKVLKKLGIGKDRGNGNGAALQQATLDNIGKTLKKP